MLFFLENVYLFLSSLNEIRLCAPLSLAPKIIQRIEEVLVSAAWTLKERESRFGKSSIETEKATFQQLVLEFCHVMLSKHSGQNRLPKKSTLKKYFGVFFHLLESNSIF